jgi:hypothetical protein
MLQNSVSDVNDFAYVKQIGDHEIACGNPPLDVHSYLQFYLWHVQHMTQNSTN